MAKAILLLHGYATGVDDFKNIIDDLKSRYEVVMAKTLPSHKRNDHLKSFDMKNTINYVTKQYRALVKKYGTIDIMGFSMGGALATYLASKGHVDKLILLAPANEYLNGTFPFKRIKIFLDYLLSTVSLESKDVKEYKKDVLISSIRDSQISTVIAMKQLLPNYTIHSLLTFRKIITFCNENVDKIHADTLILYGTVDQLVPRTAVKFVEKHCSNSKTVILPGISHLMLNSVNYEPLRDCILEFIDGKKIVSFAV